VLDRWTQDVAETERHRQEELPTTPITDYLTHSSCHQRPSLLHEARTLFERCRHIANLGSTGYSIPPQPSFPRKGIDGACDRHYFTPYPHDAPLTQFTRVSPGKLYCGATEDSLRGREKIPTKEHDLVRARSAGRFFDPN
jgi:hypothetical protein